MKWIYISCVAISLTACQSMPGYWGSGTQQRISKDIKTVRDSDSLAKTGIPDSVSKALMPPISIAFPDDVNAEVESRFDLAVKNTLARDVYLGLVKDTPYSVVINKGINSRISLNLKNVTLEEAFKAIRESYGYDYEKHGDKYIIYGNDVRTRIFYVNYINVNRKGASAMNISSGGLKENNVNANVKTESEVDFWKGFKASLENIIGKEEGQGVIINPQSGLVVVTATNKKLRFVEDYIKDTHDAIGRQVILEAKILEVELNDGYQAGINWSQLTSEAKSFTSISQVGGGTLTELGTQSNLVDASTSDLSNTAITNRGVQGFGGIFSMALRLNNFGAFIEMIQSQGDVQVLSSPRVSTVNNQKAVIKVGGDEFYVTGVTPGQTTSNSSGGTQQTAPTVDVQAFFSGIALDVTPQIDNAGQIILHLHPMVSDVSQKNKSFVIDGKAYSLPLAASTVRESDNIVKAESGQIIVVGGLMKESTTEYQAMVPFLGKIPLLGNLFKQRKINRVKKELIVLVKPTVINQVASWNVEAKNALDRFADLER